MVEAAKLDYYGVGNFIVKNREGHLVRVGIGGRSVSVNNLSAPASPQRYVRIYTCMHVYLCVYVHAHITYKAVYHPTLSLSADSCAYAKDPIPSDD